MSVVLGGFGTSSTGKGEAMVFEGEAQFTDVDKTVERPHPRAASYKLQVPELRAAKVAR